MSKSSESVVMSANSLESNTVYALIKYLFHPLGKKDEKSSEYANKYAKMCEKFKIRHMGKDFDPEEQDIKKLGSLFDKLDVEKQRQIREILHNMVVENDYFDAIQYKYLLHVFGIIHIKMFKKESNINKYMIYGDVEYSEDVFSRSRHLIDIPFTGTKSRKKTRKEPVHIKDLEKLIKDDKLGAIARTVIFMLTNLIKRDRVFNDIILIAKNLCKKASVESSKMIKSLVEIFEIDDVDDADVLCHEYRANMISVDYKRLNFSIDKKAVTEAVKLALKTYKWAYTKTSRDLNIVEDCCLFDFVPSGFKAAQYLYEIYVHVVFKGKTKIPENAVVPFNGLKNFLGLSTAYKPEFWDISDDFENYFFLKCYMESYYEKFDPVSIEGVDKKKAEREAYLQKFGKLLDSIRDFVDFENLDEMREDIAGNFGLVDVDHASESYIDDEVDVVDEDEDEDEDDSDDDDSVDFKVNKNDLDNDSDEDLDLDSDDLDSDEEDTTDLVYVQKRKMVDDCWGELKKVYKKRKTKPSFPSFVKEIKECVSRFEDNLDEKMDESGIENEEDSEFTSSNPKSEAPSTFQKKVDSDDDDTEEGSKFDEKTEKKTEETDDEDDDTDMKPTEQEDNDNNEERGKEKEDEENLDLAEDDKVEKNQTKVDVNKETGAKPNEQVDDDDSDF